MSFDPITLAMTKPKVIDLDKHYVGGAVLQLFFQGGGTETKVGMKEFWDDVSTGKNLRLEINYYESRLVIDQCVRVFGRSDTTCSMLSFNFMGDDGNGNLYDIAVAISRGVGELGPTATVNVKVS